MDIFINDKQHFTICEYLSGKKLKRRIEEQLGLITEDYYLVVNGKRLEDSVVIQDGSVHVVPRVNGGKGGFGSMLRAIGAQIEKTTNREACRDLSGRRLRDINEEQRLKNWINQQAEREKEARERKQKKLEKLCEKPKHQFKDDEYDRERSALPEKVEDAVLQGLQASCSTKRKTEDSREAVRKKKPKLWVTDELDDNLTSSDEESGSDPEESKDIKKNITSDPEHSKSSVESVDKESSEEGIKHSHKEISNEKCDTLNEQHIEERNTQSTK